VQYNVVRLQEGAIIDNDAPLLSNTRGTVAFAAVGGGGGGGGGVVMLLLMMTMMMMPMLAVLVLRAGADLGGAGV
jgi:hypothetical protein